MSQQEVDRLAIIQSVTKRHLRQKDAAQQLGISIRQIKRLVQRYREQGAAGLISRHRGKRPNNAISADVKQQALAMIQQTYADFSPTLAHEKLTEQHTFTFSVESLRQWMIADGLWQPKHRRQARIHQSRPRRPRVGELIQIDGSPHDWFEGRADPCTLLVFIDDASSRLMVCHFAPTETTHAYMATLKRYLTLYGRPVALYSDKHSIFRVNQRDHAGALTQFSRALKTLEIEPIHANTPQAKGRVERANQTLQDRLVKEMRLRGISRIDAANQFLPDFIQDYNRRFAVTPQHPLDAHREVLHDSTELNQILSLHHTRILSKNLTCQFKRRQYQLQGYGQGYRLRGARVTLCEAFDGSVTILYQGRTLDYRVLAIGEPPILLDDEKSVFHTVDQAKAKQQNRAGYKPTPDHPWRTMAKAAALNAVNSSFSLVARSPCG